MKPKECKYIKNKKYCKIKGKWVKMDEYKKHKVMASSDSPIKIHKNIKTRKGVC